MLGGLLWSRFDRLPDSSGATRQSGSDAEKLRCLLFVTLASVGIVHGCRDARLLVTNDKGISCSVALRGVGDPTTWSRDVLSKLQHIMI